METIKKNQWLLGEEEEGKMNRQSTEDFKTVKIPCMIL